MSSRQTLGDYVSIVRGTTYQSKLLGRPGPVLLGLASIERNGGFRSGNLQTYGGDSPDKLIVRPGELYASLKDVTQAADLLGAVAKLPPDHPPGRLTQDTVKLLPKYPDVPMDYIYWVLRSPQYRQFCRSFATGTTNLGLPRDDFLAYPIPEPNLFQTKLANTLSALQNKIDLNRHLSQSLEDMARTIFKSWFVDFDPVRARMKGRWMRGESLPGLPAHLYDLFPNKLIDSELGEIPDGWHVAPFGKLCIQIAAGVTTSNIDPEDNYIGLEHIPKRSLTIWEWGKGEEVNSQKSRFREGDILFGKLRPYFHKVCIAPTDGICSTDILVFNTLLTEAYAFIALTASDDRMIAHVTGSSDGTRMPRTKYADVAAFKIVRPAQSVLQAFNEVCTPIFKRLRSLAPETKTLAEIRDTLLPKLISGEIRVKSMEAS